MYLPEISKLTDNLKYIKIVVIIIGDLFVFQNITCNSVVMSLFKALRPKNLFDYTCLFFLQNVYNLYVLKSTLST